MNNLLRLAPAALLLLAGIGCSNTNLGDIDDSLDNRDDMPGPGVFAKDDGEPALSWSVGEEDSAAATTQAATAEGSENEAPPAAAPTPPDKAEFEQFKAWQELREQGNDSAEYREFQQWLQYRKFKATE